MVEVAILAPAARLLRRYGHINWALADQAVVSGSNVFTGILLARFLGAEGFGSFSLAWAILLLVASVHLPLVVGSMTSIGPQQSDEEAPRYYGAVIVQNLAFALASAVIVIATTEIGAWLAPQWGIESLAWPLGMATFATVWQEFFRRYFFTRDQPAVAFVVDALRYISQIAILIACFILLPGTVDAALALWIVTVTAAAPAAISLIVLGPIEYRWDVARAVAVRHYATSKWMIASYPIEWASEYAFMFAAGTFLGTSAVGALRATQNVAAMTNILFLSLMNVVPARAARRLHERGMAAMSAYLRSVTLTAGAATVVISVIFAAAPEFWLRLLFGEAFAGHGYLVRWWALYYIVSFFSLPLRSGLRAMERTRPIFTSRLLGGCFALAFAGLLVPWFGIVGAVAGTLASKIIATARLWQSYIKYT